MDYIVNYSIFQGKKRMRGTPKNKRKTLDEPLI